MLDTAQTCSHVLWLCCWASAPFPPPWTVINNHFHTQLALCPLFLAASTQPCFRRPSCSVTRPDFSSIPSPLAFIQPIPPHPAFLRPFFHVLPPLPLARYNTPIHQPKTIRLTPLRFTFAALALCRFGEVSPFWPPVSGGFDRWLACFRVVVLPSAFSFFFDGLSWGLPQHQEPSVQLGRVTFDGPSTSR